MNLKKGVEFVHIPKTGGTSIYELFGVKGHDHSIPTKNKKVNLYRFCFIRNPIDRFISAFEYQKLLINNDIGLALPLREGMKRLNFDFFKFVSYIDKNQIKQNLHFRPQVEWIKNKEYDFIGRFENFEKDLNKVLMDIKEGDKIDEVKMLNTSKRKNINFYLRENTFRKLIDLYSDDFKCFRYSTNIEFYKK